MTRLQRYRVRQVEYRDRVRASMFHGVLRGAFPIALQTERGNTGRGYCIFLFGWA